MKIALDAMGGDFGPPNLVAGAVMALREYPRIEKLYLVGDATRIEAELKKHSCNDARVEIVHRRTAGQRCPTVRSNRSDAKKILRLAARSI